MYLEFELNSMFSSFFWARAKKSSFLTLLTIYSFGFGYILILICHFRGYNMAACWICYPWMISFRFCLPQAPSNSICCCCLFVFFVPKKNCSCLHCTLNNISILHIKEKNITLMKRLGTLLNCLKLVDHLRRAIDVLVKKNYSIQVGWI